MKRMNRHDRKRFNRAKPLVAVRPMERGTINPHLLAWGFAAAWVAVVFLFVKLV